MKLSKSFNPVNRDLSSGLLIIILFVFAVIGLTYTLAYALDKEAFNFERTNQEQAVEYCSINSCVTDAIN